MFSCSYFIHRVSGFRRRRIRSRQKFRPSNDDRGLRQLHRLRRVRQDGGRRGGRAVLRRPGDGAILLSGEINLAQILGFRSSSTLDMSRNGINCYDFHEGHGLRLPPALDNTFDMN